jgi:hypothetical protein
MLDPNTIRLNETLYRERLQAADQARQRRATWTSDSHLIDRLRLAIGTQLRALRQQVHLHLPSGKVNLP